ncbi:MAG: DEAD/DEAH box helicase [Firmicutes bacterium]|nr:DEAD/DEAH box helicase [Bacillota bacterium]
MLNISMSEIQELASSGQVFSRGMDYCQSGLVKKFHYDPDEWLIEATVSGGQNYRVSIELDEDGGVDDYFCDCPAYYQYDGACKHIVAVLLEALDQSSLPGLTKKSVATAPRNRQLQLIKPAPAPQPDPRLGVSSKLIANLIQNTKASTHREQISLEVTLFLDPHNAYTLPYLNLKIGQERLYVVKKIGELLETILYQRELYFGKTFIFQPAAQKFSVAAERLVDFLIEIYWDENKNPYYPQVISAQQVELNSSRLKRFLEIAAGLEQAFWRQGYNGPLVPIRVAHEALPLSLQLMQGKDHLELSLDLPEPFYELPVAPGIFIGGGRFFIPPPATLRPLRPVLESFGKFTAQNPARLPLKDEDAVKFLTEAAPAIQDYCRIKVAPEVERRLHKEPLTITLWLDRYGKGISAKVLFQYGENIQINPLSQAFYSSNPDLLLLRENARENNFLSQLTAAGFVAADGCYRLMDEERIYVFLREILPNLLETTEIYRSEAFGKLRIQRTPRLSGAIRLNETTDLLEVSFQLDDLTEDDLQDFFTALQEKKKFYRLKSGAFIPLDQPETIAAGKLLDQLGLNGKNLQKNLVSLPKYRALYLDRAVHDYGRERFNLNPGFKQLVNAVKELREIEIEVPKNLDGMLRDYQKTGFKWLKTLSYYGLGGILADDMGLGKTLQIIALVSSEYPARQMPSLVIAPTSLVYNWQAEIEKFAPDLSVLILDGQKTERVRLLEEVTGYAFVITSYSLIRRDIDEIKEIQFAYCFLDEAQHIKNPETINAKSVKQIKAQRYFAVTGTPVENSLTELWSIFDFVMPGYLYSHHKFQERFEKPVIKNNDSAALEDLGQHIRPFILRRLKKEVLTELPEKIETKLICEMTGGQKKVYAAYLAQARQEFETEIQKNGLEKSRIKILALLTRLRQICCHPALFLEDYHGGCGKLELLQEILDSSLAGGHRILLFSQFVTMLDLIANELKKKSIRYFRIDGQTPAEERLKQVTAFNKGGAEVFLISLKAGGTGLNLTGADMVVHYDPWWNPAVEDQATDRAYRIGQTSAVQVFKLVTQGAVEEKIYALQQKKRELVDAVIQPGENLLGKMTLAEIRGLFEE